MRVALDYFILPEVGGQRESDRDIEFSAGRTGVPEEFSVGGGSKLDVLGRVLYRQEEMAQVPCQRVGL